MRRKADNPVEKLSLSLSEVASKLKQVSEAALEVWTKSLNGTIDEELLDFFRRRIRSAVRQLDNGIAVELAHGDMLLSDESVAPQVLLLDRHEYELIKGELAKAFQEQVYRLDFDAQEEELAEYQVKLLIHVLEDSIAVSFMSAIFNVAGRLEREKALIRKALGDVTETLERDRQRLAFDLHDGPAQALSSALLQADILDEMLSSKEAHAELASLKSIINQCLHELRTSIYSLKPQCMSQKGLMAIVKGYAKQFSARTGIDVAVVIESTERALPEVVEVNVFRVVQEALSNVAKHARASHVTITMGFSKTHVRCCVEDNGIGFDGKKSTSRARGLYGYGLTSMRDRVGQFLGEFDVESRRGAGTRVVFRIPLT
ncbi:MAG TPA: hypothetical protein DE036_06850 [Actinobacteria bacterium]|nr:hypothetical protein [Actinomycetota bacterium]